MRTEDWEQVKKLLREVLEINPSKRRDFLDKTQISPELVSEVESLLAFESEIEDFMSLPITDFSKELISEDFEAEISLVGQNIGVYEIVGELGSGGMGAVYLATRTDGKFEQKVAVKMLKREFNVEKIRRHFKREREIQAKLNHPNIARLLDAGTTADGVPYLVMEYIEGISIDKFCENEDLSLKARLKLFNKVCEAVAFAHRNLIIHRDLKPSNIIVTEKGEPKLLDFGISKLLGAEGLGEKPATTLLGAMTPEYASPEQINGEIVTTATDIYSLGVVLYKILTGKFPYNFENRSNGNILREISDTVPIQPSAVLNPKSKIQKSLKGDIDNIILKSLRKEPERRYQTVEQFSADIWRFIDDVPILARPATVSYRARKFYHRNRIGVIAGVLIFLSLVTGIAAAIWQASAAREQARNATELRKFAELETQRAKAEGERAEKISKFMMKIISYANPAWYAEGAKFGGKAWVIDALDDLGDKIDIEFAGQAGVQAELHHKFTEVYNFVAQHESNPARAAIFGQKVKFHALRALELRKQFYGERHELVAKDLFYSFAYITEDERERAALLMQAIIMMRETNPKNLNLPYMLEHYANSLSMDDFQQWHEAYRKSVIPATNLGKYEIAEQYFEEMLELFRFHYEDGHYAIVLANCYTANVELKQNKQAEADPHYQVCKKAENSFQNESQAKAIKDFLEKIERMRGKKGGTLK